MRILRETGLFFTRRIKEELRQPVWIFMGLATPLMYIMLFSPLLKNINPMRPLTTAQVLDSFAPGILTLLAFGTGMGSGWSIISELQSGLVERFRVTPASRFSMLMGVVLSDIAAFLVHAALVIVISACFGFEVHIGGLLVLLLLLCLLTAVVSAWALSLGLILKHPDGFAAVVTGLQLPLTLLSGVLLPLSLGPDWIRAIAHINPLYYAVEASRVLAAGIIVSRETVKAFSVMLPLAAIVLWWATNVYRKAVA